MASDVSESQKRRAKLRDERRAGNEDSRADDSSSDDDRESGGRRVPQAVRDAARAAAAAAAVGAAVGAVRALASRRDNASGRPEEDDASEPAPSAVAHEADDADGPDDPAAATTTEPDDATDGEAEARGPVDVTEEDETEEEPDGGDRAGARSAAPWSPENDRPQQQVEGVPVTDVDDAVGQARRYLHALHGVEAESVSSLERTADGWLVRLEVLELSRVPNTMDVLASYELDLDANKGLRSYRRVRRYYRAQADDGGDCE